MKPILEVQNIGKKFSIAHHGKGETTFRESLLGMFKQGKESHEDFWALNDVNFEIYPGESVGIIGRNGAGKSTLLKILSKITPPTTGKIISRGRIASLLEVGTGFHSELSGRENIYLNGSILGLKRAEINKQFDAIVDFSGVEKFLDTPLKHYSSGMQLRLAFAVAAHLEPEILIIDEVLAVGDAEFQKKCMGKMGEVSKSGRTILFVSHNMGAVSTLCSKGILMNKGEVMQIGNINSVTTSYLQIAESGKKSIYVNNRNDTMNQSYIHKIEVLNKNNNNQNVFSSSESIKIKFSLKIEEKHISAFFGFRVKDQTERNIFTTEIKLSDYVSISGFFDFNAEIPNSLLVPNNYSIVVGLHLPNIEIIETLECPVSFQIEDTGTGFYQYNGNDYGCVIVKCNWSVI